MAAWTADERYGDPAGRETESDRRGSHERLRQDEKKIHHDVHEPSSDPRSGSRKKASHQGTEELPFWLLFDGGYVLAAKDRIDARGNKPGVDARFDPPREHLAWLPETEGEADFPEIWPDPVPIVMECLRRFAGWEAVLANLPDVAIIDMPAIDSKDLKKR